MNIKKIIREEIDDESNEFKWIEDTQLGSLYIGALILIDKNSKGEYNYLGGSSDNFILLKITVIDEGGNAIYYITEDTNMPGEVVGERGSTALDWAKELIGSGYWQPLFSMTPGTSYGNDAHKAYYDTYMLKEGEDEFDWVDEIDGTIEHADNIQYALRKPFGITYPDDNTTTGLYWIEQSDFIGRSSPDYWKVCWERDNPDTIHLNNMGTPVGDNPNVSYTSSKIPTNNNTACTDYYSSDIVDKFKLGYWKFL